MKLSTGELDAMVEEAIVDAYDEHEQLAAFQTVIEDRLALPFTTVVLGIPVTVTALQDRPGSPIAAWCRQGRRRSGDRHPRPTAARTRARGMGLGGGIQAHWAS